jgi:DNA-binding NarL/FixJ family response regulator
LEGRAGARGLHVLVVDDSAVLREHLADSLRALTGVLSIDEAGDVPGGVQQWQSRRPDLMILDIQLPGQSGLDLLQIVRRTDKEMVIIMFSVHDHPQLRQKCEGLGANAYFHKLKEFDRVVEVCRDLAERRTKQD